MRFYTQDPRRFWGLVDSALGPGDYEYADAALTNLLGHVVDVPAGPAAQAMARLRGAASARDADVALRDLRAAWAEFDGHPRQPAVAALSARLLRPGSTRSTDVTALGVLRAWNDLQDQAGLRDRRAGDRLRRRVRPAPGAGQRGAGHGRSGLQHAVAARAPGPDAAPAALPAVRGPPLLDRLLVVAAHDERVNAVDVTQPDWLGQYADEIARHGVVALTAPTDQAAALSEALRVVPAYGIDRDVLRVYGEIRELARAGSQLRALVDIREAVQ